jgi:hypothetical protein
MRVTLTMYCDWFVASQVYKSLPQVLLAIDEIIDSGMILSLDAPAVADRVMLKGAVPEALSSYAEFTVGSAIEKARELAAKQFGGPPRGAPMS